MKKSVFSKFRRLMTLTLAMLMVFSFFGCSKQDEPDPTDPSQDQVQTDPTTVEDPTEAPTETETEAPTEAPTEPPVETVMGTVSANNLNVRSNPSTDSTVLSQLPVNLRVEILEQKTVGETNWGRIGEMTLTNGTKITGGWVNLHYVKIDGQTTETPTEPSTGSTAAAQVGIITTAQLNIRKEASGDSERVGSYIKGDKVEILETKTVDGTTWGRTVAGWISMTYVKLEGSDDKDTEVPTNPNPNKGNNKDDNTGTTGTNTSNVKITSNGNTSVLGYAVVDLGSLNVRSGPGTNYDAVGTVSNGDRFAYFQTSGNWLRIKNGWISKNYSYIEGTTADDAMTGTVTSTELNIRTGPDTEYKSNGSLKKGDSVNILAQVNGWGYTEKGWISLKYVERTYTTGKGIAITDLNARKKANDSAEILGTFKKGDSLTITELHYGWGHSEKGWVNMKYVKMGDSATTSSATATVTAETLNARKKANDSADVLGTYKKGDTVTITEIYNGWGHAEKGWINLNYVIMNSGATSSSGKGNAVVNSETLNARKKANASSDVLGYYNAGDSITITEFHNGWGHSEKGWVNLSYVTLKTGTNTTYKVGKATVFVNSTLNIRKEAKADADVVNTYEQGDVINILEVKDNWGKVLHRNGEYGWINLQYVIY